MNDAEQDGATRQLKRLREKAEFCRYASEQMRDSAYFWRWMTNIAIAILSFALSALVAMLYREILPGDEKAWLAVVVVLPPLVLLIQSVGVVFGWADKEAVYATAIHIWGQWIREADFLGKKIPHLSKDALRDEMDEIGRKYLACMEKAPSIPTRKFLCYKVEYRQQRAMSEKIDNASEDELAEIGRKLGCAKPKKN